MTCTKHQRFAMITMKSVNETHDLNKAHGMIDDTRPQICPKKCYTQSCMIVYSRRQRFQ